MAAVARGEVGFAGDSGQFPEVLVFEVGSVAPAEDFEGDEVVFARSDEFRDVESGFELAVLTVSDLLSVDPYADVGRGGTDVHYDLLAGPVGRYGEMLPVLAHVVFRGRDERRVVFELAFPAVADVDIERVAVSVDFPDSGNGHGVPRIVFSINAVECGQPALRCLIPLEFPESVEAHDGVVRVERRPHRHPVPFHD